METLGQLHALDVAARAVVDGLHAGSHRSPFKGHSVDFADHRPYVPGDDLRHLDWKVLGRRDRLVLKRFEAETDLGCTVVVDGSGSMAFQGTDAVVTKYRYASLLAASLAYLVIHQQDRAGLMVFNEDSVNSIRPARQDQLTRICALLEQHEPQLASQGVKAIGQLGTPAHRRGLVAIFSDCMVDLDEMETTLSSLANRGHDVAVVWILDAEERDLSVASVSRFQDMEGDGELVAEPRALRQAYQEQVEQHRLNLQRMCRARRVVFVECTTAEAPQHPLNRLLVGLQQAAS